MPNLTDAQFRRDLAACKAGRASPSKMADKWGARGGAFACLPEPAELNAWKADHLRKEDAKVADLRLIHPDAPEQVLRAMVQYGRNRRDAEALLASAR